MSAHLDTDALADLLAGEGGDDAVAHVGACARCSQDLADLDAALVPVAAELAALAASPLPPVPADLDQVLLARLSAAGADRPTTAHAGAAGPGFDTAAPALEAPAPEAPTPEAPTRVAAVPAGAVPLPGDVLPGGVVPLRPRPAPGRSPC